MDPHVLIDAGAAPGVPAPFWFIQFFKVLGFTLHMVPMNLWFAGIVLAMLLYLAGGEQAKMCSRRLMRQMPIIVALGVNFGIVPLLFIQLAYYQFFYPATILMAWFWMAVVGLLIPAYYGVYCHAWGLRNGGAQMAGWRMAAGWVSAALFIVIGFIYANAMSLMEHVDGWPALWQNHSLAGAALGTALNVADPNLWPRWFLMFGLALGTTAAWTVVDAAWFVGVENATYRAWAWRFAPKLAAVSVTWFAAAGTWYVFVAWSAELRETMFAGAMLPLTVLTAVGGGLPLVLLLTWGRTSPGRTAATAVGLAQFGVLGINAISRQVVQNIRLGEYLDLASRPTAIEWSPLILFLLLFVAGALVVAWMVAQVVKAAANPSR
jgi:hypothetical protein